MKPQLVINWLLNVARQDGCEQPAIVESSDHAPVLFDTESGRTYHIKLEEF